MRRLSPTLTGGLPSHPEPSLGSGGRPLGSRMSSAPRLRITTALLLAGFLGALPLAKAAETGPGAAKLDIGRFRPAPDATAGFAASDPRGLAFGQYALSLTLDDALAPLVLQRDDGSRTSLVPNRFEGSLAGLVGLYGPLSLGLEIPVIFQGGSLSALPPSTQPLANGALAHAALGDLRLVPRLVVLQEAKYGVDLAVNAGLTVPTGSVGALSTDDGIAGELFVSAGRHVQGVHLLGELGVRFRPTGQLLRLDIGNELLFRLAGAYSLEKLVKVPVDALAELDVGTLLTSPFGSSYESPAEWRVGGRYCVQDHLALTAGMGGGLSHAYGTPLARFILGVGFDPRACLSASEKSDRDGDGVSDALDQCPDVPGDAANAGCPAPKPGVKTAPADQDGDGIPDLQDQCPTVAGTKEYNGCPPPPPPDRDGDGIFDADDKCPDVPGTLEFHGCPPPAADADKDGIADADDKCPTIPGVAAYQGCPAPDRDHDGVPDQDDLCPNVPGTAASHGCPSDDPDGDGVLGQQDRCPTVPGDADHFGCPPTDRDHDGVADVLDNCPDQKGTAANHGCRQKQLVAIGRETLELLGKVQFAPGGAVISKASDQLLAQVAAVIDAHAELFRIRVEGHTSNAGQPEVLKKLSQARAEAVVRFLVGKGVKADRLEAVGYGDTRPIAPNLTRKGREANERIRLRILGRPAPSMPPAFATPAHPGPTPPPSSLPPLELPLLPPAPAPPIAPVPRQQPPYQLPPPAPGHVSAKPAAVKPATEPLPLPPLGDEPALTLPVIEPKSPPPPAAPAKPAMAPPPPTAKPAMAPPPPPTVKPAMAPPPLPTVEPAMGSQSATAKPAMAPPPPTAKQEPAKPEAKKPAGNSDDLPLPPLDELPPLDN